MSKQVNSICVKFVYPLSKDGWHTVCYNMPRTHTINQKMKMEREKER